MKNIAVVVSNDNKMITPFETIDAIKKAGFKKVFIQWYNKEFEISQEEQLDYIRKLGLEIMFAHLGYKGINKIWEAGYEGDELILSYKKDIAICKANGIDLVVMHLTSSTKASEPSEIGLNRLKELVSYAREFGVKIAFENTKIKGYLEYVLTNIKDDNVGICYDSGHAHVHFDDDFDFQLFKNRIFAVHLHDNDKSDDLHLLPFDGTIDWDFVIKSLKDNGYHGPITLELCYRYDYLNLNPLAFYKKGLEVGEQLEKIFKNV